MHYPIRSSAGIRALVFGGYRNKILVGALFIAFLILYIGIGALPRNSIITEDELFGATLVNLSFLKSIIFVLRFDIHPPLYYMQLNLWGLGGQSDVWLKVNSVAWLLATAMIVWHLVRRLYDPLAATIAAAFTVTSPNLISYAFEVRMYTFLGFLTVLGIWFSEKMFEAYAGAGTPSRRQWLAVFLASLAICYSYATGGIIIAAHFCYGLLRGRQLKLPRRFYLSWGILHVVLGLLSLPVVINSMIRRAGHAAAPDTWEALTSVTELFFGSFIDQDVLALSAFAILGLTLIGILVASPASRHLIICYVIVPILLVFIVSHVLKPAWLMRSFLFGVPVVGVAIGRCLGHWWASLQLPMRTPARWIAATASGVAVCLQAASGYHDGLTPKQPDYSILAAEIRKQALADDCVVVFDHPHFFWGLARYLVSPEWGDALDIQAPPDNRWAMILRSTPPGVASFFWLTPRSDHIDYNGIHVFAGFSPDAPRACRRIFAAGLEFEGAPPDIASGQTVISSGILSIRGPYMADHFHTARN